MSIFFLLIVMRFPTANGQSDTIRFANVADAAKLSFHHYSPLTEERHLHLFMGSGLAWIDHDLDSRPDLYLCQGQSWPPSDARPEKSNQLLRNTADGTFENVTDRSGLQNLHYSMGAAAGDFDNDGFPDLFVSGYGPNSLYHNNGDGTWTEITDDAGMDDSRFGSGCTWADIDGDGNSDLYVANYLALNPDSYPLCTHTETTKPIRAGCHPRYQNHEFDILYRNNGNGTFTDITQTAGLKAETARSGLGVVTCDFDGDDDLDFYVANDTVHNQLWINDGTGKFIDDALLTGVAVNRRGLAEAGMGTAVGDINGDGRFDLFVTNYFHETNTLYRNEGFSFTDVTAEFGLGAPSKQRLAFGTSMLDADNDSWPDIFAANGHVQSVPAELKRGTPFEQLPQLFRNEAGRRFSDASETAGTYFTRPVVGRSSAVADFDGDGRIDICVQHLNGPVALLQNQSQKSGNFISLKLTGVTTDRSAIGTTVEIVLDSGKIVRMRNGSTSYLACDDPHIHAGVGPASTVRSVTVRWLNGNRDVWTGLAAGTAHHLVEGRGNAE